MEVGLKPRVHMMPPEVQLQREAWIAYTEDKAVKAPIVFGDLGEIYASGKNLDLNDRKNQENPQPMEIVHEHRRR